MVPLRASEGGTLYIGPHLGRICRQRPYRSPQRRSGVGFLGPDWVTEISLRKCSKSDSRIEGSKSSRAEGAESGDITSSNVAYLVFDPCTAQVFFGQAQGNFGAKNEIGRSPIAISQKAPGGSSLHKAGFAGR
mgnify:CR=1 FL=1